MEKLEFIFKYLSNKLPRISIRVSCVLIFLMIILSNLNAEIKINTIRTPNGGIQPKAAIDTLGNIHLIYYNGEQGGGNLFYVIRLAGKEEFSAPIQVNSVSGSAVSAGSIRGGQIVLGKDNRVHVAWNGSKAVKNNMEYTRLNDSGTAFETEKSLMFNSMNLDGGGSVAADDKGNVYVVWHGNKIGEGMGEGQRQVWIASSNDDGKTFSKEIPVLDKPTGVCGCCALHAFVDRNGSIEIMYRSASEGNRDVYLIKSKEGSKNFQGSVLHSWKVAMCPMSTMNIAESPDSVVFAWQTEDQIYFSKIKQNTPNSAPKALEGSGKFRKHPAVTFNKNGDMIIAWTEGTGWARGGDLVWQVYDKNGSPTTTKGKVAGGIPIWGLPTVVPTEEGFIVIH